MKWKIQLSNNALLEAKEQLEKKAADLERASVYKSEFLANMSHELRTPLNSLLILATLLTENNTGNLTPEQVEFAHTIYSSGNAFLSLIKDVLDLSKVEAGKIELDFTQVDVAEVVGSIERTFRPLAAKKNLEFVTNIAPEASIFLQTDTQRLDQILKNLLANAFKFTDTGTVTLQVGIQHPANSSNASPNSLQDSLRESGGAIFFSVRDTGMGIPQNKLEAIFEAFEQVDGSINRKYGGTGLGLAISRELALVLDGEIHLQSVAGSGSNFTLHLPLVQKNTDSGTRSFQSRLVMATDKASLRPLERPPSFFEKAVEVRPPLPEVAPVPMLSNKRTILLVEDDENFLGILSTLASDCGFHVLKCRDGETALEMLRTHSPHAVVLDLNLPGMSGYGVLENLKANPRTRHIPVHIVSGVEQGSQPRRKGAMGYLTKPASLDDLRDAFTRIESILSKDVSRVLVVEDDLVQQNSVCKLISGKGICTVAVSSGLDALARLRRKTFDCMVLELKLPDMTGFDLLDQIDQDENSSHPPVIVYTARDLTRPEEERLRKHSESIIVKGVRSPDRLLDEVSLFLHRVEADFTPEAAQLMMAARTAEKTFEGRKILVADDDLRNTFALLAALEPKGFKITVARNGLEALRALEKDPTLELVLMDIMMPEMDGYEAIRALREIPRLKQLPVIALTAKAMKGDKEKCIEAGANDYLSKPIVLDHLLSLLRVWLPARGRA